MHMQNRHQRGFTLTEVMISIGIVGVLLMGTVSTLTLYKSMESHQKDRLQSRLLLSQTAGELMATPHKYPRMKMNGEDAGYVTCYDQKLSPIDYNSANTIGYKSLSELEPAATDETNRPIFCDSKFEVRFVPLAGDPLLQIKIYIRNPDRSTGTLSLVSSR